MADDIKPDKDEYGGTGSNMSRQWGSDVRNWPYESQAKDSKPRKIDEKKWAY